ncbi:hypothetical protein VNO77_18073 [Canavalia gladiata]|uniref:Uncharacterized protein n=1 Tax=Canavalia gladiata TaxID=3824 RepID=A0AAN9LKV4_CANGL
MSEKNIEAGYYFTPHHITRSLSPSTTTAPPSPASCMSEIAQPSSPPPRPPLASAAVAPFLLPHPHPRHGIESYRAVVCPCLFMSPNKIENIGTSLNGIESSSGQLGPRCQVSLRGKKIGLLHPSLGPSDYFCHKLVQVFGHVWASHLKINF